MSDTKEPYKWYWAYTESGLSTRTFLFDTREDALNHAIKHGEFDEVSNKDYFIAHEENLLFELAENDTPDYEPFEFPNRA